MTMTGQNVSIYKGDDKILVVTVKDSSGNIEDISGTTVNYVVYKFTIGNIVITKTTSSGISLTDPTSGIFEITLIPSDTENLLGYYLHECELTDTFGKVSTIFTGKFTVIDSKA